MTSRGPGAHSAVKPLSPPLAVLHVVPSINAKTGGPAASVPGLAGGMAREGVASTIASLDYPDLGAPFEVAGVEYLYVTVSATGRVLRGWSPSLARTIRSAAESVGVVHSHALWMVPGIYARRAAQACALPLVISPRGMLDPWSLARHGTKKRLAALLYEGRNLRAARLLHATSEAIAQKPRIQPSLGIWMSRPLSRLIGSSKPWRSCRRQACTPSREKKSKLMSISRPVQALPLRSSVSGSRRAIGWLSTS